MIKWKFSNFLQIIFKLLSYILTFLTIIFEFWILKFIKT